VAIAVVDCAENVPLFAACASAYQIDKTDIRILRLMDVVTRRQGAGVASPMHGLSHRL
jgi:hypothetical protein